MWRSLGLSALALLVAACGTTAGPGPTLGDLTAVEQALALRGATIVNGVGGDPGCTGTELHSNAVRFDVRVGDEPVRSVYLFRWRRPAQFDDAADEFARCLATFEATADEDVTTLEVRPWRAFGAGWSEPLGITVEDALRSVGGS